MARPSFPFAFLCAALLGCDDPADPGSHGGTMGCPLDPLTITHDVQAPSPRAALVHVLDTTKHPDALCNDGSPGAFVFRPGSGRGADRWVIYLEGGGNCGTSADCEQRYLDTPGFMGNDPSTQGRVFSGMLGGIKSSDPAINPDFHDANYVQIAYCSSDFWSGDAAGDPMHYDTSEIRHWHFRGRRIVEAVMDELGALGLDRASEVLLAGSSAGGVGVVNEADDVAARLPASARFAAMMDAGFFFDYPSFDPQTGRESAAVPTERAAGLMAAIEAWGGRGDADCEDAAAGDPIAHLLCRSVFDVLRQGYVRTPIFIRQSEYDNVQLKQLVPTALKTPEAEAYRARFAARMIELLGTLTNVGVFAMHDKQHGIVADDVGWTSSVLDGTTLSAAFGAWYRDPCGTPVVHVAP